MSKILLNIGCGLTKLKNYINIDSDPEVNPDLVLDITKGTPYQDNSISEILMIHTIEHIPEKYHERILLEYYRILVPEGKLFISYPEFTICAKNYIENVRGMREYWKNTIYGRQTSSSDFHCALMDTLYFGNLLREIGFDPIHIKQEPAADYNTMIECFKSKPMTTYEQVVNKEIFGNDESRDSS